MLKKNYRFGINMIEYCKEHERYIREQIDSCDNLKELLSYHNKKLEWLQHERKVHLSVTLFTAFLFLFLIGLELFLKGNFLVLALLIIVLILLAAYILHYFKLENTVQRWYMISDKIYRKFHKK